MAKPDEFARRMRARGDQIADGVNKLVRKVGLTVLQAAVTSTPVDTGRARSNWNVEFGRPDTTTREAFVKGQDGSTGPQNSRKAIEQGGAKIATRVNGQDIWISNNVPYIGELNNGHSAQAPAGFVQRAVQAGRAVANRTRVVK